MKPSRFGRVHLYRSDFPKGQDFEGEAAIKQALRDGWVDCHWQVDNPDYRVTAYGDFSEPKTDPAPEVSEPAWKKAVEARKAKAAARRASEAVSTE